MNKEMFLRECKCGLCWFEWTAMFPEGLEDNAEIECPSCGGNSNESK